MGHGPPDGAQLGLRSCHWGGAGLPEACCPLGPALESRHWAYAGGREPSSCPTQQATRPGRAGGGAGSSLRGCGCPPFPLSGLISQSCFPQFFFFSLSLPFLFFSHLLVCLFLSPLCLSCYVSVFFTLLSLISILHLCLSPLISLMPVSSSCPPLVPAQAATSGSWDPTSQI